MPELRLEAKKLTCWLWVAQFNNASLTPQVMCSLRHTLKDNFPYAQVKYLAEDLSSNYDAPSGHDELPNYLQSQVDAQNITDNTSLWTQIKPLLEFIRSHFASPYRKNHYPTLFVWYSKEKHRSFYFVAFLQIKMDSKSYTARELLQLRHRPLESHLAEKMWNKLKRDTDLINIVRIPQPLAVIEEEPKKPPKELGKKVRVDRASAPQLDGTNSEWKYAGRSDSEHNETNPISAPADLAAQKSEGFQRFYQAVVSPTHVRVTAGGRIVPNTRTSVSPSTKWNREQAHGDPSTGSIATTMAQAGINPFPIQHPHFAPFASMLNGFAPGMHPGMASVPGPYPMIPMPMGFNIGSGYAMPSPAFSQTQDPNMVGNQSNGSSRSDKHSESGMSDKPKPVRVSPPDHQQFYPCNMMPPQSFQSMPMPGQMIMAPAHNGAASMASFASAKQNQSFQQQTPVPNGSDPAMAALGNPPISSIRPSEITRKQIDTLRSSLRYFEDQLQYNKHQIDEKATELQAQQIRTQIGQFEKNLEDQLSYETDHYPKPEPLKENEGRSQQAISLVSGGAEHGNPTPNHVHSVQKIDSQGSTRQSGPTRLPPGLNSTKSTSAFHAMQESATLFNSGKEMIRKSSSLPVNAALAKPFQPRADQSTPTLATAICAPQPAFSGSERQDDNTNEHLIPKGGSNWRSFFESRRSFIDLGVPYLVGKLPEGVAPENAKDTDYVYDRELNDDELRARHMFWGKTPHFLQKGLPKFDGKDFYAASPGKPFSSKSIADSSSDSGLENRGLDENVYRGQTQSTDIFECMATSGLTTIRSPLGHVTQSESLHRPEESLIDTYETEIPRPISCMTQVSSVYRAFRQPGMKSQDSSPPSPSFPKEALNDGSDSKLSPEKSFGSSSDEKEENLIFQGRQTMERNRVKPRSRGNTFLSSVLKKGKASVNAAPGKVSPTTAQGVLPNYSGHATASLAPRTQGTKLNETNTCSASVTMEKRVENRPPVDRRGANRQNKNNRNISAR